jgi:DNA-binding transcriptional MerR regulator
MTRLSVKALRNYDELGLLVPREIDRFTGYRYYGLDQVATAEAIRRLRSLDMPLAMVGRALEAAADPDRLVAQLEAQRTSLRTELERQSARLAALDALIEARTLTVGGHGDVAVERIPAGTALTLPMTTAVDSMAGDIEAGFGRLVAAAGAMGIAVSGPPWITFHDLIDDTGPGEIELGLPTAGLPPEGDAIRGVRLAAFDAAVTIHTGPIDAIAPAYAAVLHWIDARAFRVAGPPREVYLDDPRTVGADALRTRIEWPVETREGGEA